MDENMNLQKILSCAFVLVVIIISAGCTSAVDSQISAIPLFQGRQGFDLKRIVISDVNNNTIEFKRVDCVWVIGQENRPADEQRVTVLADKIATLTPLNLVTQEHDRYNDFNVGDTHFNRKVVLKFKDNSSSTLLIGAPALTKPAYVRLEGKNIVYSVDEPLLKQLDMHADSWLAPQEG
jgi:hypothetical protein